MTPDKRMAEASGSEQSRKERPILFSAPMVRAILDGSKTQTRRTIKPSRRHPIEFVGGAGDVHDPSCWGYQCEDGFVLLRSDGESDRFQLPCPYGKAGDLLWVRETWAQNWNQTSEVSMDRSYVYRADGEARAQDNGTDLPWRPSIHMPRAASRITLEITGVRVERLNDCSEADVWAEGIDQREALSMGCTDGAAVAAYSALWERINGVGAWDANPWVWVIEFKRCPTAQTGTPHDPVQQAAEDLTPETLAGTPAISIDQEG